MTTFQTAGQLSPSETVTAETVAARFGCTVEQAKAGFRRTAETIRNIAANCEAYEAKGKKRYSGYPATKAEAARLRKMADNYELRAK